METTRNEINRANAQHSTGPKTAEGKQRSSRNALRHGLSSDNVLIPGEDPKIYDAHVAAIYDEHNPQTETESILVQLLADLSWRLLRVATLEANLLAQNINYSAYNDQNERLTAFDKLSRALSNLSLHSQRISRQFDKTLLELRNLQKTRPEVEPGFVFTATVGQAVPPAEANVAPDQEHDPWAANVASPVDQPTYGLHP